MKIIIKVTTKISSLNTWFEFFPPKGGKKQWKEKNSALEFAKKVLSPEFENDIKDHILKPLSNDANSNFRIIKAMPECITKIDEFKGGQRNHDLALIAKNDNNEKIAICFEAKVQESFGSKVEKQWKVGCKENSNIHDRIKGIWKSISNSDWNDSTLDLIKGIKYQILTGIIGTIKYAEKEGIHKCVFCVYQLFEPADDKYISKHEQEIKDLMEILMIEPQNDFLGLIKSNNIECYIKFLTREIEIL